MDVTGLFLSCVLPKSREFACVVIGSQKMVVLVRNPLSSELQCVTLPAEGWSVGDFLRSWCQAQVNNEGSNEKSGWRGLPTRQEVGVWFLIIDVFRTNKLGGVVLFSPSQVKRMHQSPFPSLVLLYLFSK